MGFGGCVRMIKNKNKIEYSSEIYLTYLSVVKGSSVYIQWTVLEKYVV